MTGLDIAQYSALIIFAVNTLLMGAMTVFKAMHRRRMRLHDLRRSSYVSLLSRHLAFDHCTDPITARIAQDPAFLDALIDVRHALAGPEIDTLEEIVARHGVVQRQVERLRSPFPLGRRLRAAVALAEIGDESAAPVLIEALDDREPEIRIQAARGLGRIRWTPAIDPIVWRLGSEIPWVRLRYSDTLASFGTSATWPLLAYVKINHRHEIEGPKLALRTIAQIEDRDAIQPILEVLDESTNTEIRIAAIEALGELRALEALPALRSLVHSAIWELRAKSVSALGRIGDSSSIPLLREGIKDDNWWVRRNSAAALSHLPGGVAILQEIAISASDEFAADAAAEALALAGETVPIEAESADGQSHHPRLLLIRTAVSEVQT